MTRTPVADWQQLSALYEAADALDPVSLAAWLVRLRAQSHPLLKQLEQMLAARAKVRRDDFLGALPALPVTPESAEPKAETWAEGSRIGPYKLVRHLGEGGMAEVWMAQRDDGAFQRTVAIKLLFRTAGSTQRDSFAQRFARERDILASLDHPNIAGLHDAGVMPSGQPWLALEYVEGQTLIHWCDTQRLDIAARVRLFRQVLLAVQHAHANLVIHRDLKPGNILVTVKGEVRLLDFGIAKLMEAEGGTLAETELTRMAGRPMTPQYAAPEQLLGQPLTTACDVYSLGVVLYQLLCGERPYELKLDSAAQLEQSIIEIEPRGPSRRALTEAVVEARSTTMAVLHKTLASDLDAIVLRALAKEPAGRYASAEAFRADLDRWLAGEAVEARVPSAAYRASKFVRRHRLAVGLSVGAVLSLIGVTVVAVVLGLQAREDSARAGAARDFMLGLFKRADQEKARGADITARELLETGRKDVLARMVTQPRLQAELLQGIANIQKDMGEYVGADSTFADAARVYERIGMPREAAMALTEEANAAVRMGNLKLAETAMQQASVTLGKPGADPELNARMTLIQGWVEVLKGNMESAKPLFALSHDWAMRAFGPNHPRTMDALRAQIYAEQKLRRYASALELLRLLEATAAKTSGVDAKELEALSVDRAELLNSAGRYGELLNHLVAVLPNCASSLGANDLICRELMFRRVDVMVRLGMFSEAAKDQQSLELFAEDQKSPALAAGAKMLSLRLAIGDGQGGSQVDLFDRVRALVDSDAGKGLNPNTKIKALLALAEARLRVADPAGADRWLDQAQESLRRLDGANPRTTVSAMTRALQGVSALQRGHAERALDDLLAAQNDLTALFGPGHPNTRLQSLNVAIALRALGRTEEAKAIVTRAEPILREAMGSTSPMYARVTRLLRLLDGKVDSERAMREDSRVRDSDASTAGRSMIEFFS